METPYSSNPTGASYIEWSAIIAGAVLALALAVVLLQFGAAIGLADLEDLRTDVALTPGRMIVALIFVLLTQLITSMLGGYIAGRMRAPMSAASEHEREVRDGIHGLLAWATATLAVVTGAALVSALAELVDRAPVDAVATGEIDREKVAATILAFAAGATSLVSAVAAYFAGTKGGDHRDRQIDLSRHLSFRIRVIQ